MGNTTGKRISRSHTTAIPLASEVAIALDGSNVVTKIMLGIITARSGCKTRKIIIANDQFNLRLTIQQPPSKQELYVSAPDRELAVMFLEKWCKENGIEYTVR